LIASGLMSSRCAGPRLCAPGLPTTANSKVSPLRKSAVMRGRAGALGAQVEAPDQRVPARGLAF
jgi:hypothetical protein